MAKDNSELIDVNSDVKDRVMEVSHIQSLIYVIRGRSLLLRLKSRYQHRSHSRPENRMFLYMRHMTSFRKNMRYRRMTSLSFMVLHLMTSIKSGRDLMQAQAR